MHARTKTTRYLRFTPGLCLAILATAEVFLVLAERFRWYEYNHWPGWTTSIMAAAAAATIVFLLLWFVVNAFRRRPFQFGLRTLLLAVFCVAIPSARWPSDLKRARECNDLIERLKVAHAEILGENYEVNGLGVIRDTPALGILGFDMTYPDVTEISMVRDRNGEPPLYDFRVLPRLESLTLHGSRVDFQKRREDFDSLVYLPALRKLRVYGYTLSALDVEHLATIDRLESLSLIATSIDDDGLQNLTRLQRLRTLDVTNTRVTSNGLRRFQLARPDCELLSSHR
jgi:hypothetical protein